LRYVHEVSRYFLVYILVFCEIIYVVNDFKLVCRISLNSTFFYNGKKETVYSFLETLDVPANLLFTVVFTVCPRYSRNTVLSLRYVLCWTCVKGVFFSYSWIAVGVYISSAIAVIVNVTVTV